MLIGSRRINQSINQSIYSKRNDDDDEMYLMYKCVKCKQCKVSKMYNSKMDSFN